MIKFGAETKYSNLSLILKYGIKSFDYGIMDRKNIFINMKDMIFIYCILREYCIRLEEKFE